MNYKLLSVALAFLYIGIATSCSQPAPDLRYQIEVDKPLQTMEHFGASDAWSMHILGLWPQEKQNQIADWLFSTENDANGKPKGIGLSLWRFNVGAGSTEQGEASQIGSSWMRTECFMNADGIYDWNKQQGQRNFLKLAKERGVTKFLAFLNSPPVYYTQNGLATNTGRGGTANLKPECYEICPFPGRCSRRSREARRDKVQLYLSFQRTGRALELGRTEAGRLSGNQSGSSPNRPSAKPGVCEPENGYTDYGERIFGLSLYAPYSSDGLAAWLSDSGFLLPRQCGYVFG